MHNIVRVYVVVEPIYRRRKKGIARASSGPIVPANKSLRAVVIESSPETSSGQTLSVISRFFFSASFFRRASPLPPPPAVSSTLILRSLSFVWCILSAFSRSAEVSNSMKAHPFDSPVPRFVSKRIAVGAHAAKWCSAQS